MIELETSNLRLFTPRPMHAGSVRDYLFENRNFFEPWTPAVEHDYFSASYQLAMIKKYLPQEEAGSKLHFYMQLKNDNESIIGDITLSNIICGVLQSAFIGYKLDEQKNGRGLMREGLQAVIEYAFSELNLHRVEAHIIPRNERSIRVIEALGFEKQGYMKEYLLINNKWEDHLSYALVNRQWERN